MSGDQLANWRLKDFDVGGGEAARAFEADSSGPDWIDIAAPGDTYLALRAAGRIPDPFAPGSEEACAWVEGREWWWRADFDAAPALEDERLTLDLAGLDTFATVWLNGEVIGRSGNMFAPMVCDIGNRAR